jgi:branched-chain amino acid transport system substrate-binding protein
VAAWDAMAMIFSAVKEQSGKLEAKRTLELFKHWKGPDSPRGPVAIDPETRDIVQNEYLREVRKVDGRLVNVELQTVGTAVKDPWKERQRKDVK